MPHLNAVILRLGNYLLRRIASLFNEKIGRISTKEQSENGVVIFAPLLCKKSLKLVHRN